MYNFEFEWGETSLRLYSPMAMTTFILNQAQKNQRRNEFEATHGTWKPFDGSYFRSRAITTRGKNKNQSEANETEWKNSSPFKVMHAIIFHSCPVCFNHFFFFFSSSTFWCCCCWYWRNLSHSEFWLLVISLFLRRRNTRGDVNMPVYMFSNSVRGTRHYMGTWAWAWGMVALKENENGYILCRSVFIGHMKYSNSVTHPLHIRTYVIHHCPHLAQLNWMHPPARHSTYNNGWRNRMNWIYCRSSGVGHIVSDIVIAGRSSSSSSSSLCSLEV